MSDQRVMSTKKSAVELIRDLDEQATDFASSTVAQTRMGVVVRAKDSGKIVWHDDQKRETELDTLVKDGWEPIGLIRVADHTRNGGKITIDSCLFEEYRGDLATKTAMKSVCRSWGDSLIDRLAQCGGHPKATYFGGPSDWLQ
jgi:hypothetical protein